jgi:two-component system response regulator MprA
MVRTDRPSASPEGPPVLVVDDDDSIRSMLIDTLSYEGYRVIGARDGMEALAAMERETPFVVLLDVLMPMLDGGSFANAVRESGMQVPIVVMTASDAPGRSREIHADAYVPKPFDLPDLLATVARFRDLARSGVGAATRTG